MPCELVAMNARKVLRSGLESAVRKALQNLSDVVRDEKILPDPGAATKTR